VTGDGRRRSHPTLCPATLFPVTHHPSPLVTPVTPVTSFATQVALHREGENTPSTLRRSCRYQSRRRTFGILCFRCTSGVL
jgi:hypothetical protein